MMEKAAGLGTLPRVFPAAAGPLSALGHRAVPLSPRGQLATGRASLPQNRRWILLQASKKFEMTKPLGLILTDGPGGAGAKIQEIAPDGNAAKLGGMEVGMTLLSINGVPCKDSSYDSIMDTLIDADPSKPIQLEMWKEGVQAKAGPKDVTVRVFQKGQEPVVFEGIKTGSVLRTALIDNDIDVYDLWGKGMNCNGAGTCLTCLVDVKSGGDKMEDYEKQKLKGKPDTWRLACQTIIEGDVEVYTKPQAGK